MRIVLASGKGGTGKTTLAVNMAAALSSSQPWYVDCDVEEPNGHLFLAPTIENEEPIVVGVPRDIPGLCTGCGECQKACQFRAILSLRSSVMVFDSLCHSCGTCLLVCPEKALREEKRRVGTVRKGEAEGIHFLEGRLNVGEARAAPAIAAVRACEPVEGLVLADAPPGATCPTKEAVQGSDLAILVTEPTPFGLHDLGMVLGLTRALSVPSAVVVNRADLGDGRIRAFCREEGLPIIAEIPHDERIAAAGAAGRIAAGDSLESRELFTTVAERALDLTGSERSRTRGVTP